MCEHLTDPEHELNFLLGDHINAINQHGVPVRLFFRRWSGKEDNEKKYCGSAEAYDKDAPIRCQGDSDDEDDGCPRDKQGNHFCQYSNIAGQVNKPDLKQIVKYVTETTNKFQRCKSCDKLFQNRCPECYIQGLLDKGQKSMGKCSICQDKILKRSLQVLVCNHRFHQDCISKLTNKNCPNCRKPIEIKPSDDHASSSS